MDDPFSGIIGGIEHAADSIGSGIEHGWDELTSGAWTAPDPQVTTSPPATVYPKSWTAPDVSADGQVSVHRDALTTAATAIRSSLPKLDAAINQVASHSAAFSSLMSWETGKAFGTNLGAAVGAFSNAGQQTSQAHDYMGSQAAASRDAYEAADSDSAQAASSVQSQLPSGGVPATGNWS